MPPCDDFQSQVDQVDPGCRSFLFRTHLFVSLGIVTAIVNCICATGSDYCRLRVAIPPFLCTYWGMCNLMIEKEALPVHLSNLLDIPLPPPITRPVSGACLRSSDFGAQISRPPCLSYVASWRPCPDSPNGLVARSVSRLVVLLLCPGARRCQGHPRGICETSVIYICPLCTFPHHQASGQAICHLSDQMNLEGSNRGRFKLCMT